MKRNYCVVLITASSPREAERISKALVSGRLAACVSAVPGLRSRYWWKKKVETARETLLIVKTRKTLLSALVKKVKSVHSYSVPEVLALPVLGGNADYLRWIDESI